MSTIREKLAGMAIRVEQAPPAERLDVYRAELANVASEIVALQVAFVSAIDKIQEIAASSGLVREHGQDVIQRTIAAEFVDAIPL